MLEVRSRRRNRSGDYSKSGENYRPIGYENDLGAVIDQRGNTDVPPRASVDGRSEKRGVRAANLGGAIALYARNFSYPGRVRLVGRVLKLARSFSFNLFLPH